MLCIWVSPEQEAKRTGPNGKPYPTLYVMWEFEVELSSLWELGYIQFPRTDGRSEHRYRSDCLVSPFVLSIEPLNEKEL